ncbi:hypothetical protein ACJZ2D_013914 [Fusarium nematophilum]
MSCSPLCSAPSVTPTPVPLPSTLFIITNQLHSLDPPDYKRWALTHSPSTDHHSSHPATIYAPGATLSPTTLTATATAPIDKHPNPDPVMNPYYATSELPPDAPGGGVSVEDVENTWGMIPTHGVAIEATYNTHFKDGDSERTPVARLDARVISDIHKIEACIANPHGDRLLLTFGAWVHPLVDLCGINKALYHEVLRRMPLQAALGTTLFLWSTPLDRVAMRKADAQAILAKVSEIGLIVSTGSGQGEHGMDTMSVRDNLSHGEQDGRYKAVATPYVQESLLEDDCPSDSDDDSLGFAFTANDFNGQGLVQDLLKAGAKPKTVWLIFLERDASRVIPSYQIGPSTKAKREAVSNRTFHNLATKLARLGYETIQLVVKMDRSVFVGEDSPGQDLANLSGKRVVVREIKQSEVSDLEFGWFEEMTPNK